MGKYVLGVAGGASKTVSCIADLQGNIIGCGKAGCTNVLATSWQDATTHVRLAVVQAIEAASILPNQIISAHYGLGGINQETSAKNWQEELAFLTPNAKIKVENDVFLPIYSLINNCQGVAVVSGSSGNIGLIDASGTQLHLNGKVNFSSAQLGKAALNIAVREIHRKNLSTFSTQLLALAGFDTEKEFIYQARVSDLEITFKLAPLVSELAKIQDSTAIYLVKQWLATVKADLIKFLISYNVKKMPICFGVNTFISIESQLRQLFEASLAKYNCWLKVEKKLSVNSAIAAALAQQF